MLHCYTIPDWSESGSWAKNVTCKQHILKHCRMDKIIAAIVAPHGRQSHHPLRHLAAAKSWKPNSCSEALANCGQPRRQSRHDCGLSNQSFIIECLKNKTNSPICCWTIDDMTVRIDIIQSPHCMIYDLPVTQMRQWKHTSTTSPVLRSVMSCHD